MTQKEFPSKIAFAKHLGISRSLLYYNHKLPTKDWALKQHIEVVLHEHPSYGHKRLAIHLGINKKRILRVMHIYGMKPYRRRGKKWRKTKKNGCSYPNLLITEWPQYPHHIWATDFTHLTYHGKVLYLATVMDLFTREVVGFSVLTVHSVHLVMNAVLSAVHKHPPPSIIHSDQGSEYTSKDYGILADGFGICISMSHKASPWENGYQESFYSQFKVDLGDPNRFSEMGALVWAIYKTIHDYNNTRIHTRLKMPPALYARRHWERSKTFSESVS